MNSKFFFISLILALFASQSFAQDGWDTSAAALVKAGYKIAYITDHDGSIWGQSGKGLEAQLPVIAEAFKNPDDCTGIYVGEPLYKDLYHLPWKAMDEDLYWFESEGKKGIIAAKGYKCLVIVFYDALDGMSARKSMRNYITKMKEQGY